MNPSLSVDPGARRRLPLRGPGKRPLWRLNATDERLVPGRGSQALATCSAACGEPGITTTPKADVATIRRSEVAPPGRAFISPTSPSIVTADRRRPDQSPGGEFRMRPLHRRIVATLAVGLALVATFARADPVTKPAELATPEPPTMVQSVTVSPSPPNKPSPEAGCSACPRNRKSTAISRSARSAATGEGAYPLPRWRERSSDVEASCACSEVSELPLGRKSVGAAIQCAPISPN
jgi:hypothetical protein